jgi:hypothetical protein
MVPFSKYLTMKHDEWVKNGELHRITAPSTIGYFENGTIHYKSWFRYDMEKNIDYMLLPLVPFSKYIVVFCVFVGMLVYT